MRVSEWQHARKSPEVSGWYQVKYTNDGLLYWRYYDSHKRWLMPVPFSRGICLNYSKPPSLDSKVIDSIFGNNPRSRWRGVL